MFRCSENELRAAEASRKEKEKKEAEQREREEQASEQEDASLLEEKSKKLEHTSQKNGLHTIGRTEVEKHTDDVNDNQVPNMYIIESNSPTVENTSLNDVRLEITPEKPELHPLLAVKSRGSIEKIHFETGL